MEEFSINSFKYGLDTRRDALTSQLGTLYDIRNAHINPGGEIEKRKAFEVYANTAVADTNGDDAIFGLEVTTAGLVRFGHALVFGTTPTQSQPVLISAMPAGVTYQQLQHPSIANDTSETYTRNLHRITAVPFSINFNGKTFAAATFSDGNTFLYYDGDLVQHSANGLVLSGRNALADLGTDLARQLTALGFTVAANVDEDGVAQDGSVIMKSAPSDYYTPDSTVDSSLGKLGFRVIDQDVDDVVGTSARASFDITVNTGTFILEAPAQAETTTPTVNLCGGSVAALGSVALTAAAIARAVNDFTSEHGYSASANATTVFVYAPLGYDVSVALDLTVTPSTGTVIAGSTDPSGATITITPSTLNVERIVSLPGNHVVAGTARAQTVGATGYSWSEVGVPSGITIGVVDPGLGASFSTAAFRKTIAANTEVTGSFKCVSTTEFGEITAFITVRLKCTYNEG